MWGCIAEKNRLQEKLPAPSLYVRVYRPPHIHTGRIICSLIICEGVSAFLLFSLFYLVLPHYMWGCIALKAWMKAVQGAPSLYVRVYRPYSLHQICRWRSLIICEGVSELKKCYEQLQDAPSLYVRVYRSYHWFRWHLQRSLIICEGVSQRKSKTGWTFQLPHYMWGCIPCMKSAGGMALVPSLYVRVYRLCGSAFSINSRSLIICEGVSHRRQPIKRRAPFPHYMWGCIVWVGQLVAL